MAKTLQSIRDAVRLHLDLDTDDMPDIMLDDFIREGSKRIERAEERWPFYEADFILTTTPGIGSYPISGIATNIDRIHAIIGLRWTLKYLGVDTADVRWPQNITEQGEPSHYSVWLGVVRLKPVPDAAYNLVVHGYRKPIDWVAQGAGGVPDMPDELHNTVQMWALARAYNQQDDPEMGAIYERMFADELNEFRRRLNGAPLPQPIIANSTRRTDLLPTHLQYDWGYTYRD